MPRSSDPNRCLASECEPIGRAFGFTSPAENRQQDRQLPPATKIADTQSGDLEASRLHDDESKRDIVTQYGAWLARGKRNYDSPIPALIEKYNCDRTYPKKLYDKFISRCTVDNNWNKQGRPLVYDEEMKGTVVDIIRAEREKQHTASCRKISRTIKKKNRKQPAPCAKTVNNMKRKMGFKKYKVQHKPALSKSLMNQREMHAQSRIKRSENAYLRSIERKIFIDEKWFSESKGNSDSFEARPNSPIKQHLYKSKASETKNQEVKIMYLLVVSLAGPIDCVELPFKEWNEATGQLTKQGKKAKGITADFMRHILKKVAKKAVKVLGPGPIDVEFDKAGAHKALVADGDIEKIFGGKAYLAAGKAPDMSPLDAGACPYLERVVEQEGAQTKQEIRAAVKRAWKKVDKGVCEGIMKRVRRNMSNVIRLNGGNFYRD